MAHSAPHCSCLFNCGMREIPRQLQHVEADFGEWRLAAFIQDGSAKIRQEALRTAAKARLSIELPT